MREADTALDELPAATRVTSAASVEMRVSITGLGPEGPSGLSFNARTAPATGDMTLDAVGLDDQNVPVGDTFQVDRVGGAFLTYDPVQRAWSPGDPFGVAGAAVAVEEFAVHHTLSDVLPPDARPFASLVESTTETLDALPIETGRSASVGTATAATPAPTVPLPSIPVATTPETDAAGAIASSEELVEQISTAPTPVASPTRAVTTTRYRIDLDVAAFAAEEPSVYAAWSRDRLAFEGTVDVWIDDSGHLRRVRTVGSDGVTGYDVTWVAMSTGPIDAVRSDDQADS